MKNPRTFRKPHAPNRLLKALAFQEPPLVDLQPPPAASVGATRPLIPFTPSVWQQWGDNIAAAPMGKWKGMFSHVPAFYRPILVYGLCRHALADTFDDAGFSAWWRSPFDELGGGTPGNAVRENRCDALLEMVVNYVTRGQI